MDADANIQVWLETIDDTRASVIVPYVQSTQNDTLHYRIRAVRQASGGRSEITQSGVIATVPDTPVAFGRMAISRSIDDKCQIELTLHSQKKTDSEADMHYQWACPA